MPNRIIKESIHTSETVNRMTDFQFRLWVSLITYVDDYGRGDARPAIIKGACFPLRERVSLKDLGNALAGLADIGCVRLYTVDGKPYLYLPGWEEHQRIRTKVSKYPEPPQNDSMPQSAADCSEVPQEAARARVESESRIQNPNPESEGESARTRARASAFVPPTVEEVEEFVREKGLNMDAQEFVDYYSNKRWRIGSSTVTMSDWKAAARNWAKKEYRKGNRPVSSGPSSFDTDDFFEAAQRRAYSDTELVGDLKKLVGVTA